MFEFDDIIEEAVADVIEQAKQDTEIGRLDFDPDNTDGYQFMMMVVENLNDCSRIYNTTEQKHLFNMLMHVMHSVCSDCTGEIIFYNQTTKEYTSEVTGRKYKYTPVSHENHIGFMYYHEHRSFVAHVVKFSFDSDLSINARLSKLLRMFTTIQSFKNYRIEPFDRYNCYNCFLFKNTNDEWTPMQRDRINIKDIYENFHDASKYDKAFDNKIIWYYKDFFLNKDDSNELLVPVIEELKHLMCLRWAIKVDSNYLRKFGRLPRQ